MPRKVPEGRPDAILVFDPNPGEYITLKQMTANPDRLYMAAALWRPGVQSFMSDIEMLDFPWGTPENDLFEVFMVHWPEDEDLQFLVIGVPKDYRPKAEALAKKHGLRIANGLPTIIKAEPGGKSITQFFPADHDHVFTLENTEGHPVYKNDPELLREMLQQDNDYLTTPPGEVVIIEKKEGQGHEPNTNPPPP